MWKYLDTTAWQLRGVWLMCGPRLLVRPQSNQTCPDGADDLGKGKLHPDLNTIFTKQINQELFAFYTYLSMATFFGRSSVALPGCQKFFLRMSDEEKGHAQCLIDYQNMRGSVVEFCAISVPEPKEWKTPEEALKDALALEESVRQNLEILCQIGAKFNDSSLCDFISTKFIQEQVRSQNEIRALIATAARLGNTGIGVHLFDMMLQSDKTPFENTTVFQ